MVGRKTSAVASGRSRRRALGGFGGALVASAIALTTAPASAQTPDEEWAAELEWIEASVLDLDRDGRPEEALELLENMTTAALVDDRRSTRRLIRLADSLRGPDAEPEWLYAGVPLLIAGALGLLVTGIAYLVETSCGFLPSMCIPPTPDLTPFTTGYVLAGTAFVTGLVLTAIGLATHTFDPARAAFDQRRNDVIRRFRQARRGVGVRW